MQKNNMISIFVCMLLIAVSVSSVTGNIDENEIYNMKNDDYNNLIKQAFENGVISTDDWLEQDKLLASDGAEGNYFGISVSIDGDYAIIGAYLDDDNGDWSGSAYVFKRDGTTWAEEAKLLASDGAEYDCFGISVSIDGDYAIVGAYCDGDNGVLSGSAYVFTRSGTSWIEQAKLLASDGEWGDYFGVSVSIDGDYAIIGADCDGDNGDSSGSAYVFTRSGTSWIEQDKLLASDGAADDWFGRFVSIDGDYAIVGAIGDDDNGDSSGSAYVFTLSGTSWIEQDKLLASDGAADDYFGWSVSISGDYAIIGAYCDDDNGLDSGSAYVFKRDGTAWIEQAKLLASDGAAGDRFGVSVSIDGDYAIIGAFADDDSGDSSGSAYVFTRSGTSWIEQDKLLASDGAADDYFGWSVSISGDYAIVGACLDGDNGEWSGSAYVFTKGSGENQPPETPDIDGPTEGTAGEQYTYEICSTDPEGDDIVYCIDFGDDTGEVCVGPFPSGTCASVNHTWTEEGTYTVKAKATDIYGAESDWATLEVEMPVNQHSYSFPLLQMILERFPNAFPILRYLLGL